MSLAARSTLGVYRRSALGVRTTKRPGVGLVVYVPSNQTCYFLNTTTFAVTRTLDLSAVLAANDGGVGYDGTYLWFRVWSDSNEPKIAKIDAATGEEIYRIIDPHWTVDYILAACGIDNNGPGGPLYIPGSTTGEFFGYTANDRGTVAVLNTVNPAPSPHAIERFTAINGFGSLLFTTADFTNPFRNVYVLNAADGAPLRQATPRAGSFITGITGNAKSIFIIYGDRQIRELNTTTLATIRTATVTDLPVPLSPWYALGGGGV